MRRLYERVGAVVAHATFGRDLLVEQLGVPAGKVHVIPHGAFDYLTHVQTDTLPAELGHGEPPPDGPVVLFFGLLRPYKGIDVLLRAWSELAGQRPEARLWIVGRPRIPLAPLQDCAPS